jgi:hypothetical protein
LPPQQQHSQQDEASAADEGPDWLKSPEHAAAIIVHHEAILKLKRILLTYM